MSSHIRVLIIEDSEDDSTLLARELKCGGFEVSFVERVDSSTAMALALDKQDWDLVVCDYSMPNFSGDEALEILKGRGLDIPFIFVSGTTGEDRAVAALKQGAHDYVMKQNLKRLVPAIQRELREAEIRRERSRMQQKIQQLERFEAIGQLAGGIAHDFNNVIGAIQGWAHLGYEEATEGSRARARFLRIRDQAQRAAGLTAQLLAFARRQVLQPRNMSLNDLISETLGFLRSTIGEHIETQAILDHDLRVVCADSTQIQQVLMNLCFNARDAMLKGGRLFIKTENADITNEFNRVHSYGIPGEYALLSVSDTGIGMDKATMERAFEPFFTTKEVGTGTGLGLATVYGIVKQHGGFV